MRKKIGKGEIEKNEIKLGENGMELNFFIYGKKNLQKMNCI